MSIKGVIKIYLENQFLYTDELGAVYMFNYGNANEAQKEAISATDGLVLITDPVLLLVKRAVYLIQAEQIMMAFFTEKAAKEQELKRNISVN